MHPTCSRVLSGIIGTVGGRLLRFVSVEKVGAPVAASIINLNPFIASGLGILVLMALGLGEVSVVAPLAGTAPLFVLPFTQFFLKGVESLTGRIIFSAIFIVLGVFLLTLQR